MWIKPDNSSVLPDKDQVNESKISQNTLKYRSHAKFPKFCSKQKTTYSLSVTSIVGSWKIIVSLILHSNLQIGGF